MLRISRLTDYGTMVLAYLAQQSDQRCSASEVATATRVALPTVQKLLKVMARGGLVTSARGAEGGYQLARPASDISAAEIVSVLEGPVAVTECSAESSECELEPLCLVGGAWQKINDAILGALESVSLADLEAPAKDKRLTGLRTRAGTPSNPARPASSQT
ncbi:MAG: SUF system Fe-S cluster assembly regulator [Gammaproteobacteria bacterium]